MSSNRFPSSGVIEGFFGAPWPNATRRGYAQFLRARGFDFYVYAPKAERYLRRAWREPIPGAELEQLRGLSSRFRENGLRFGVGLTPYEIHLDYGPAARAALKRKVTQLDQAGIDMLCILFDDMRGDVPDLAAVQARTVADSTEWTAATAVVVCPTYYSDDPVLEKAFGRQPPTYLQDLGRALDPAIDVFWTGERVCSDGYSDAHLESITARLGREPFIWDNHSSNDGKERCSHLYLDPRSAGWSVNPRLVTGIAINPMNQPHLSRLALSIYASLLGHEGAAATTFESQAASICGAALAAEIFKDLDLFQSRGLMQIDASERERLIEKYRRFEPDGCAHEIGAWLRDEYRFDPNCLTQ